MAKKAISKALTLIKNLVFQIIKRIKIMLDRIILQ